MVAAFAETLKMEPPNTPPSAPAKYVALNDSLYDYITRHRSRAVDPVLDALRAETEALGDIAKMLISPEQGDFLTLMTELLDVRTVVEVGTFTGYSAICLARGLPGGGRLYCFDVNAVDRDGAALLGKGRGSRTGSSSAWATPNKPCHNGSRGRRSTSLSSMPINRATTLTLNFFSRA